MPKKKRLSLEERIAEQGEKVSRQEEKSKTLIKKAGTALSHSRKAREHSAKPLLGSCEATESTLPLVLEIAVILSQISLTDFRWSQPPSAL